MSMISKAFKAVRGIAIPAIATAIGGPGLGALAAKGVGFYESNRQSLMGGGAPAMPGGGMMETAGVPKVPSTGGFMQPMLRWLIGPRGIARNAMGKMMGVMRGVTLFRNKRIVALARQIGIEAAAVALGITIVEVSEAFITETGKRRRARGISGRDIRVTRRTINKIRGVERDLAASGICRPRARSSSPRSAAFVRQG